MFKIVHLIGDGISKEISNQSIKLLNKVKSTRRLNYSLVDCNIGYSSYKKYNNPLTKYTLEKCMNSNGIIMGAVGDPRGDNLPIDMRPEQALLKLRKELDLYCNIRPVILNKYLENPIFTKNHLDNTNIEIYRELSQGIYNSSGTIDENYSEDLMKYDRYVIERIYEKAFKKALYFEKELTIIDKANVLRCSRLWRQIGKEYEKKYPNVKVKYQYVDSAAFDLIKNPSKYEIIVTSNLFGDILSDESAVLSSSLGMLPSSSLSGKYNTALYEPISGSAPDIAGKNEANPIGMILSTKMMLEDFGLVDIANNVEDAVDKTLQDGYRTKDIYTGCDTEKLVGTEEMGDKICDNLKI